jgi:hypothetical protein
MGRSQPTRAAAISDGTGAESPHNQSRTGFERRRVGSDRAMNECEKQQSEIRRGVGCGRIADCTLSSERANDGQTAGELRANQTGSAKTQSAFLVSLTKEDSDSHLNCF